MATHPIVIIHGVGDQRPGYSQALQEALAGRLGAAAAALSYHEVYWADIGQPVEDALIGKGILPDHWPGFDLRHPIDSVVEVADRAMHMSTDFRRFIFGSIGDVMIYLTPQGKAEITGRLKEAILAACAPEFQQGVATPWVTVVAHSLGSVVMYDVARYFGATAAGRAEIGAAGLANIFTFGSPLALFSLLEYGQEAAKGVEAAAQQQLLLGDGTSAKPYTHPYSQRGIPIDLPDGRWLNFYDQQDPFASLLGNLYPPGEDQRSARPIEDIAVQTGTRHAHTYYWQNDEVADRIAEQLKATLAAIRPE